MCCVLLYGDNVWPLTVTLMNILHTAYHRYQRSILAISWRDKITNEEVGPRTGKHTENMQKVLPRQFPEVDFWGLALLGVDLESWASYTKTACVWCVSNTLSDSERTNSSLSWLAIDVNGSPVLTTASVPLRGSTLQEMTRLTNQQQTGA